MQELGWAVFFLQWHFLQCRTVRGTASKGMERAGLLYQVHVVQSWVFLQQLSFMVHNVSPPWAYVEVDQE